MNYLNMLLQLIISFNFLIICIVIVVYPFFHTFQFENEIKVLIKVLLIAIFNLILSLYYIDYINTN